MEPSLRDLAEAESMPEICRRLGEYLGMDGPIAETVVMASILNPEYGRRLMSARGSPELVQHLLDAAPKVDRNHMRFRHRETASPPDAETASALHLAAQASASLLRWATSAFVPVDDATFERRWSACQQCEHLSAPPDRTVYKIATAFGEHKSVCAICGCVAARKARIPHESCPSPHPADASRTRWGEPR